MGERLFQCSMADECEKAHCCAMGKPHSAATEAASTCYDIQPYHQGGVLVWDDVVESDERRR